MKYSRFLALTLSLIVFTLFAAQLTSADYDAAYELYKAKKYSEAIPMLEEWCNKYPKDPRGGYTLAQCYVKTKQSKKALDRLAVVLEHHDDHGPSQFLTGVLKLKASADAAIPHFEAAIKSSPDNASYHYYMGTAKLSKKDYAGAIESLQKSANLKPKSKTNLDLGRAYLLNGDPASATAPLKAASKGKRTKSSALYYLGLAEYQNKNYTEAVSALEKASAISKDDPKVFYNLGMSREAALGSAITDDTACKPLIEAYKKAVELDAGNADYQFRLGAAYESAARAIYSKTAGNEAISNKALGYLGQADKAFKAAIAADAASPAKDRVSAVAQMVDNIKNPSVIEEEVTE